MLLPKRWWCDLGDLVCVDRVEATNLLICYMTPCGVLRDVPGVSQHRQHDVLVLCSEFRQATLYSTGSTLRVRWGGPLLAVRSMNLFVVTGLDGLIYRRRKHVFDALWFWGIHRWIMPQSAWWIKTHYVAQPSGWQWRRILGRGSSLNRSSLFGYYYSRLKL